MFKDGKQYCGDLYPIYKFRDYINVTLALVILFFNQLLIFAVDLYGKLRRTRSTY